MAGVIISHKGAPCTPPVVDGLTFVPLGEDDLWVAECSEEQAAHLTRVPAFTRFGGGRPFPATGNPAAEAQPVASAQADAAAQAQAQADAEVASNAEATAKAAEAAEADALAAVKAAEREAADAESRAQASAAIASGRRNR